MSTGFKTVAAASLVIAAMAGAQAYASVESARQALSNSDFPAAIQQLDAVLAEQPGDAEALFLKGLALARSGDTAAALEVFNELTANNPEMAEAWNNLGVLRARNGDLEAAREALEKAVRINPEHGPAQENLGDIYVSMAQNAYTRAGELERDNNIARAKSQQLADFIGAGMRASAGTTRGEPRPPRVPGLGSGSQVTLDPSTPQSALESWAKAWSAQDVDAYLSMYAPDFVPADGMSRSAWAAQRRERVSSPARIEIDISNTQIQRRGEQALVRFDQRYRSDTYQDRERKALLLTETADGWRILREGLADNVSFTVAEAPVTESVDSQRASEATSPPPSEAPAADSSSFAPAQSEPASAPAGSAPAQMQAESRAQARRAVEQALQDWAKAWSSQNVERYLNAYSDNYQPRGNTSLSAWVRDRRQAVSAPAWIKIDISDIQVSLLSDDRAQAIFNQHYQSNTYEDRERKRVTLVREDGGWRIVRES